MRSPLIIVPLTVGGLVMLLLLAALGASLASTPAGACGLGPSPSVDVADIPASLMPLYEQASSKYELASDGWAYLASINYQETTFGTNLSTSSTGAAGWMQFEPGTWGPPGNYGVDPQGDHLPFLPAYTNNPADAIFSAANYLHASGAPGDWIGALTIYGNAGWYATQVATRAQTYLSAAAGHAIPISYQPGGCGQPVSVNGYADPFAHSQGLVPARVDMGVDYRGSGEIDAIGNAQITFARTGIGGNWVCSTAENGAVVYRLEDGQFAGDYVYVAEDVIPTVQEGQQVSVGQQIATFTSPTGCLEIGFSAGPAPSPEAAALAQQATSGDVGDNRTYCGQQMSELLAATGAPPGLTEGKPVIGNRCE